MNKPIDEKLRILSDAAKYDVSCSSSGSGRKNTNNGLGNGAISGICHSWSADGRCVSLLKILMTNYCIYDCKYCISRKSNDIERAILTPDEIVRLTINFYRRNYIEGLFLSSGVIKNADYTMEQMITVAKKLRLEERFNGYIHMKVIPGASRELIHEMGLYVDRVSVNIELAESKALKLLAPDKKPTDISTSMGLIRKNQIQNTEEKKLFKSTPSFIPAGQTTQMIIGAGGESDYAILSKSENLYKNFDSPVYLTHLYLMRLRIDNFDKLKIRGYDSNGNIVVELNQLNNKNRRYVGFRNYKKVAVSKIKIFTEDLKEAYVIPRIMYGELSN